MYDNHENPDQSLPPELAALEQQLTSFAPAAPRIERDRLMFAAGAASVQPRRHSTQPRRLDYVLRPGRPGYIAKPSWLGVRFWQSATALATAASLLLATRLVWQSADPAPVVNVAAVESGSDTSTGDHSAKLFPLDRADRATKGYLGLRYAALTQDVSRGQRNVSSAHVDRDEPRPATARQILEELLPERSNTST